MGKLLTYVLLGLVQPILSRIIGAIGFGLISFTGVNTLLATMQEKIASQAGSLSGPIFAIIGMSGFGVSISVIFSALVIRAYLNGMNKAGDIVQSKWSLPGK